MDNRLENKLISHLADYQNKRSQKANIPGAIKLETTRISYGTSGFRGQAAQVEHLFFNVGYFAALRSLYLKSNVGVMITASHNPIEDNGVKLIDDNGEMLDMSWEPVVEEFCNTQSTGDIIEKVKKLFETHNISTTASDKSYQVLIGMDTRPSSEALATLVKQGLDAWSPLIDYVEYGQITTPALHYLVAVSNKQHLTPPITTYYDMLIRGVIDIFSRPSSTNNNKSYSPLDLVVDCANGVGSETMHYLCNNEEFRKYLPIKLINTGVEGILNKMCGADHVKTNLDCPVGAVDRSKRYASLDGDADRVVYFYITQDSGDQTKIKLLDGDKIMALFGLYLKDALKELNLEEELSFGIVQTAYANGSSTDYLTRELGMNIHCVDTGVKNLHKKVIEHDIGVYFEANGHGSIWTSPKAIELIDKKATDSDLKKFLSVVNRFTGDAISDILAVEVILRHYDWNIEHWYNLYSDRPSKMVGEHVPDRYSYKTTNAGRILIEPVGLQEDIDTIVAKYGPKARCFARASGTEDKVRIYSEAETQELADQLAEEVRQKIKTYGGS